ncbi:hypothetical protein [Sphingobium olei]|uniref:Metallophosphoesterase n=1 Tax=Sphingobium olei TaxID=420955 RepID=A0ABW3NX98_9SPHN
MIRERQRSRRPIFLWLAGGIGVLVMMLVIFVLISMADARSKPIVRHVTLHLPGFAANSAPTKIALLADIHLGNRGMKPARPADIVG